MFSYVARSLASKTLRTFLGKYLEDIELDSVDYGAAASAAGKSGPSGWGVSLSNVKLREGTGLVTLPGKRRRTVLRKKRARRTRAQKTSAGSTPAPAAKSTEEIPRREGGEAAVVRPSRARGAEAAASERASDASRARTPARERCPSAESEEGYFSSSPSTPTQGRRGACGVPSAFCRAAPFREGRGARGPARVAGDAGDAAAPSDDDAWTEVEEEVVVEDALELVVGAGGVVGTLDIRWIGKELHVTVEDANLVVEAVPRAARADEGAAAAPPGAGDGPAGGASPGAATQEKRGLAHYLSLLPRLFLRDCQVSLILPETGHGVDDASSTQECTVFEAGIRCLSVTEGEGEDAAGDGGARKRLRTGEGPDGGAWLRIYPPREGGPRRRRARRPAGPPWARQKYSDASASFFCRASGVDVRARMSAPPRAAEGEDGPAAAWSDECEDYTLDSMLFGVDYVDPVSLRRHRMKRARENYGRDADEGVRTLPFASDFHWKAQTAHRGACTASHLPRQDCFDCWNAYVRRTRTATPVPGCAIALSVTEPLEVNADRRSLEAVAYLASLCTAGEPRADAGRGAPSRAPRGGAAAGAASVAREDEDAAFPPHMRPEAVSLSSAYVATLIIRVEALRPRAASELEFRFWQFVGRSLHLEVSQVDAEEQFLQDVTLHVGSVRCDDFAGACETRLLVAGTEPHGRDPDVRLPCTARRVLGAPAPMAPDEPWDAAYAVHLRLVRGDVPEAAAGEARVAYANLRLGIVDIDIGAALAGDIAQASREGFGIFSGDLIEAQESGAAKDARSDAAPTSHLPRCLRSRMLCQVSTKGGTLSYRPTLKMQIPESTFRMRNGAEGFSCDTVLRRLGVEYGSHVFERPVPPSILPLCALPENLRMHVLLYLDDITPLERLCHVRRRKCTSPFLRCHAVNKQLPHLSTVDTLSTKERVRRQSEAGRHTAAMRRLRALDVEELEALLARHAGTQDPRQRSSRPPSHPARVPP